MERLYYEENHHKLHEETFEEVVDELLDKEEEAILERDRLLGMYSINDMIEIGEK